MATSRKTSTTSSPRRPPATTPEGREQQLIALATDLAEKQMREGTASSQIISLYLKAGTSREQLELEKLRNENLLLQKRAEQLESSKKLEELYEVAIAAMQVYSGRDPHALDAHDD